MKLSAIKALTDNELVDLIQRQTVNAEQLYSELMGRHQVALLHRCYSRLGNTADAEDVVQETLSRGYRYMNAFKGDSSFKTWLFSIADNQCYSLFAAKSRYELVDDVAAIIDQNGEYSLFQEEDAQVQVNAVRQAWNQLPEYARDVLMLRFDLELSLMGISQTLGISLSASKMRLYRAIELFEKQFSSNATV
ncbi:RNA polymerase sigma factor [Neptunomonas antarctica]|uniref:RNA polymerase sigma-70 factor, ECF subfamily n=1 Tax=Neptunomonas antarctica TaxID=619304 RepID=A0A1N7J285_9GAMM|nr:RNA polymerase sigma factor [Neptunomonas antarctica]SIS43450.1 RNA polymerase sigma-70 factor, ECF subfamily [Neptunomonas antarctica]